MFGRSHTGASFRPVDELEVSEVDGAVIVGLRVSPRAAKTRVLGVHDGALKLSITAPPVDGAANKAIVAFFAKALSIPKQQVQIESGERGRSKRVRIEGVRAVDIEGLLP